MAYLDELLVYKLNAALAGDLKQLDLRLDKEVKGQLGNEQARSRSGRVSNSRANVQDRQVLCGIDLLQRVAEHRVEDVVDPGTTAKLLGRDLSRSTVNRRNKG